MRGAAREAAGAVQVGRLAAVGVWGRAFENSTKTGGTETFDYRLIEVGDCWGTVRPARGLLKNASIRIAIYSK